MNFSQVYRKLQLRHAAFREPELQHFGRARAVTQCSYPASCSAYAVYMEQNF
jgi:hypothetical protein